MLVRFHAASLTMLLLAGLLTIAPQSAHAKTYNWPDPIGGCLGESLSNCINTIAHPGDTMLIGYGPSNFVNDTSPVNQVIQINQNVVINNSITLASMNGFDAVFTPGTSITINSPTTGAFNVSLSRLYLTSGHVTINHNSSSSSSYTLSGLRFSDVDANASTPCAISFNDSGMGAGTFDVGDSELDFTLPRSGTQPSGICASGLRNGSSTQLDLFRNRFVTSNAALASAIVVSGASTGTTWIENNQIRGNYQNGIIAQVESGQMLWIHDNVATGASAGLGIYANVFNSTARIVNNTVVQNEYGLMAYTAGSGSTRVANNLVAFNQYGLLASGISNGYNLFYGNTNGSTSSPGVGDVLGNPLLVSNANPHLTYASPARNAGNIGDVTNPVFVPAADADGETRVLWNSPTRVDIGAYEFSSDYAGASPAAAPYIWGYWAAVNPLPASSNGMPIASEQLIATPVATNSTYATDWGGTWGVFQDPGSPTQWAVYKEDKGVALDSAGIAGDSFNIFAPRDGHYHMQVTTGAGTSCPSSSPSPTAIISGNTAIICDPRLNGAPWVTAFATHDWTPIANIYNTHPVGMYYDGTNWRIRLEDSSAMPSGLIFNVVVGPMTVNAFTVRVGGIPVPAIVLYNQKLDNNPCAAPIVTATDTGYYYGNGVGVADPIAFGVKYVPSSAAGGVPGEAGHWEIVPALFPGIPSYYQFPANSAFNVMVDGPQADTCGL